MSAIVPLPDQLADLRADLGDTGPQQAFGNDELARLWQRAGGDHTAAVILGIRQLLMEAAKRTAYTVGQSREEADQTFVHLREMLAELQATRGMIAIAPSRGGVARREEFAG